VLVFESVDEKTEGTRRLFTVAVMIDGELYTTGTGYNKKDAGQVAARSALEKLGI
jgi:ribonuclease-3